MDTSTHSMSQPALQETMPSGLMFKFPKLIYTFQNRGDGRDSHNLHFDAQTITICTILSLAWAGLIFAYGMGITATMGVVSIPSFVYASLVMMILFPIAVIWGGFFVYHYTHQSYKASNEILEAARILGSPALIATEDVKTLSSAVGHELNCLRSAMRDVEDQMNGISKRIDSEIHTLNESSDKLHHTLSDVSGTIRAERDAIVDLMKIIKKENDNARSLIAERNKTHIQVNDIPQSENQAEIITKFDAPNQVGELQGGEITYVNDLRNSVAMHHDITQNAIQNDTNHNHNTVKNVKPHNDYVARHIEQTPEFVNESIRKPVQFTNDTLQKTHVQFQAQSYVQKPEAIILRRERQLYEGVCALTVDLNRELGIVLPQDLWSRYMRGERHVFADYLFSKLDTNFNAYQEILESEILRKLCNQFIARFETLRERLFDEPDVAVSEYLENSGVGKIYNLLSVEYV
jgi:hypothetical protein